MHRTLLRLLRDEVVVERLTWFAAGLGAATACFVAFQVMLAPTASAQPPPPPRPTPGPIRVQVVGAVAQPGVYELSPAARVEEALGRAGGPTAEANLEAVSLLGRVQDGERLVVPRRNQPRPAPTPIARVNLNTASQLELERLPGIGAQTAQKILAHREKTPFTSVEQLHILRLLPLATVTHLRDRLAVE